MLPKGAVLVSDPELLIVGITAQNSAAEEDEAPAAPAAEAEAPAE